MHNTKVVDLEKLSKSGIQHFFIWSQEEGEKLKLQNWVLELWSNYEIATDRFFHLRLPAPRPRRRRTPAKPPGRPTRRASAQNRSRAPGLRGTTPCWRPPELDTRLRKPVTAGRRSPLAAPPRAASPQFAQPRLALPLPLGL